MKQHITKVIEIDIGHRVMDERFKCFSMHGHRIKLELTFEFTAQQAIGYQIDFKEIKRVAGQWIDDQLDHGFAVNPQDFAVIEACKKTGSKLYVMSLNGPGQYCNPTAENLSREIFLAVTILFEEYRDLKLTQMRFYETPNNWVDTTEFSITETEKNNFYHARYKAIKDYINALGFIEYDGRKVL